MKHTYLYPVPAKALFLWRLARTDSADLFGCPDHTHAGGYRALIELDDVFAPARRVLSRITEPGPRVCIGEGYVIPGSADCDSRHHALTPSVEHLTRLFWDAPVLTPGLYEEVMAKVERITAPGSEDPAKIRDFLRAHTGLHIIPRWM